MNTRNLGKKTVKQLKSICAGLKLRKTGRKLQLCGRIVNHLVRRKRAIERFGNDYLERDEYFLARRTKAELKEIILKGNNQPPHWKKWTKERMVTFIRDNACTSVILVHTTPEARSLYDIFNTAPVDVLNIIKGYKNDLEIHETRLRSRITMRLLTYMINEDNASWTKNTYGYISRRWAWYCDIFVSRVSDRYPANTYRAFSMRPRYHILRAHKPLGVYRNCATLLTRWDIVSGEPIPVRQKPINRVKDNIKKRKTQRQLLGTWQEMQDRVKELIAREEDVTFQQIDRIFDQNLWKWQNQSMRYIGHGDWRCIPGYGG
jgi:hypothetical protein